MVAARKHITAHTTWVSCYTFTHTLYRVSLIARTAQHMNLYS